MNLLIRGLCNFTVLSILGLLLTQSATAAEEKKQFTVNDDSGRDTVRFVLDAPLEVINGHTNKVTGKFVFEKGKLSGEFTVPVTSLKTGIDKRDEHLLNEKWMSAKTFPTIELSFKDVKIADAVLKGKETTLQIPGEFKIHGAKKTEQIKLTLQYLAADANTAKRLPGNLLRAKAEFQILLSDYGIAQSDSKVKELLGLKVGKTAAITADLMASDKSTL